MERKLSQGNQDDPAALLRERMFTRIFGDMFSRQELETMIDMSATGHRPTFVENLMLLGASVKILLRQREVFRRTDKFFEPLSEFEREVVGMRFGFGGHGRGPLTEDQIAEALNCQPEKVKDVIGVALVKTSDI